MKKYKVLWIFLTCAALALASLLVQNNYLIILADQIIISIIVLMGLNFVTGMMGQMNLGTAGIMARIRARCCVRSFPCLRGFRCCLSS